MAATQCPECGGAKLVHQSRYDRTKIPSHERNFTKNSECDTWQRAQTVTAGLNAVTCRVCGGVGTL